MPQVFDCYTITGEQVAITTRSTDRLTEMLDDPNCSSEVKQAAADLLSFAATQIEKSSQLPPLDQAANRMCLEFALSTVYPLGSQKRLVTEVINGVKHQSIM